MLKKLKVLHKIILLSVIFLIFIAIVGATGFYFNEKTNSDMTTLYKDRLRPVQWMNDIRTHARANEADLLYLISYSGNPDMQSYYVNDINTRTKIFNENWGKFKETKLDEFDSGLIPSVERDMAEYFALEQKIIELTAKGSGKEAFDLLDKSKHVLDNLNKGLKDLSEHNATVADEIYAQNNINYKMSVEIMAGVIAVALVIGILFSILIAGGILKPIRLLRRRFNALAENGGDLTQHIDRNANDEIGDLAESVNKFIANLRVIMTEVNECSDNVGLAAATVSDRLVELNDNIEETSAAIEEISAGMEETAAATEQINASSAEMEKAIESMSEKALSGAGSAREISKRAGDLKTNSAASQEAARKIYHEVKQSLETALNKSKAIEQIAVFSDAILQISTQTNLLALNAAIEAARAGEAGRGFAVVSDEIRKLAEDSKNAVNEIQRVTREVVGSVEELAGSSRSIMQFMDTKVMGDYQSMLATGEQYNSDAVFVDTLVTDFSATAQELSASADGIIRAIDGVAKTANEGAAGTQSIAEKSTVIVQKVSDVKEQMNISSENAQKLKEAVAKFKV